MQFTHACFSRVVHTGHTRNDGSMFADLFTEEGVFGAAKGRAQLTALARTGSGGEAARHFASNVMITPTERGATGTQ